MLDSAQISGLRAGNLKDSSHKKRLHRRSIQKYLVTFQHIT